MFFRTFDWDESNREHIRRHRVDSDEVEEAFVGKSYLFRTRDDRFILLGLSAAGRRLFIVFEYYGAGVVRVVTARDMDVAEVRLYRRKI